MRVRCRVRGSKLQYPHRRGIRGFTLIEMLVVITLILMLVAIAIPNYSRNVQLSREAKLHQNLATLNKVIQEYSLDKKKAPGTLDDLVTAGYLKFIPDDITGSPSTWVTEPEVQDENNTPWDPNNPGICCVHSGSEESSLEGGPYSSWTH